MTCQRYGSGDLELYFYDELLPHIEKEQKRGCRPFLVRRPRQQTALGAC